MCSALAKLGPQPLDRCDEGLRMRLLACVQCAEGWHKVCGVARCWGVCLRVGLRQCVDKGVGVCTHPTSCITILSLYARGTKTKAAYLLMSEKRHAGETRDNVSGRGTDRVLWTCLSNDISPNHVGRARVSLGCNPKWNHLHVLPLHVQGTCVFGFG